MIIHQSSTPQWRILDEAACQKIVEGAFQVLHRTGVLVLNDKAQQLLRSFGCVSEGARFFVPPALVQKALSTAPRNFTIWGRDEKKTFLSSLVECILALDPPVPIFTIPIPEKDDVPAGGMLPTWREYVRDWKIWIM